MKKNGCSILWLQFFVWFDFDKIFHFSSLSNYGGEGGGGVFNPN